MTIDATIRAVQKALGLEVDGKAGIKTWTAIYARVAATLAHARPISGKASSFADQRDVAAFRACKALGKFDQECFKVGDNGIGCYGDDTTNINIPYVAIRPDDMIAFWGSVDAAKHKSINLTIDNTTHECIIGDRMPWAKNVTNGAVVDLAPGAQALFSLRPPFIVNCSWTPVI